MGSARGVAVTCSGAEGYGGPVFWSRAIPTGAARQRAGL